MYSTDTQQFVPKIIHQAYENDYVPFEVAAVHVSPGASVARGVYFTITCSEGVPFITAKDLADETKNTYVGPERVQRHIAACKDWPKGNIPPSYLDPVKSDLPVLMISGEVDGSSPTWFGESALKFLPNGRQLKIRYLGHQFEGDCISDIFTASSRMGPPKTWTRVAQRKFDGRLSPRSYPHGLASTKAVLGLVWAKKFRRRGRLRSTIIKGLRFTAVPHGL